MIYVVGQVVFDSISELKQFPKPNSTSYIKKIWKVFGGAAGNVAAACSKMGQKASLVSFVGEDFKGSAYEKYLKSNRIDMTHLKIVKGRKPHMHSCLMIPQAGKCPSSTGALPRCSTQHQYPS